jgi:hypothetical protein
MYVESKNKKGSEGKRKEKERTEEGEGERRSYDKDATA